LIGIWKQVCEHRPLSRLRLIVGRDDRSAAEVISIMRYSEQSGSRSRVDIQECRESACEAGEAMSSVCGHAMRWRAVASMCAAHRTWKLLSAMILVLCLADAFTTNEANAQTTRKSYSRIERKDNFGCLTLEYAQDMQTLERNRNKQGQQILFLHRQCYRFKQPIKNVSILERASVGLDTYLRVRVYTLQNFYDLWFPEHDLRGTYHSVPGWSTGVFPMPEPVPQEEEPQ